MIYKFNKVVLDTENFTLVDNGELKSVEPQVFDLIVYLIKHRKKVSTRLQIFNDLWSGRVVSDATLSNHIKSARAVLGDDGSQQSIIKTVRGRGYQFVAENIEVFDKSSSGPQITKTINSPAKTNHTRSRIFPALLTALLLILFFLWRPITLNMLADESKTVPESQPYILVVPFTLLGNDTGKWRPFIDQMTREVIQNLQKISGLHVIPATSAFIFRENKTPALIQEKLPGVRYVLDADIKVSTEGIVRITPHLDDIQNNKLIWDDHFESQIDSTNLITTQSDIATSVSNSLKIVIKEYERKELSKLPTENLVAYELYVKGKHQYEILTAASLYLAVELFNRAIALDPNFIDAYLAKADSYRMLMTYFEKPVDMLPYVVDSVVAALKINPESAEARSSLGLAYVFAWRWNDAWIMLNDAHDRNPRLALTELGFAIYYAGLGDAEGVQRSLTHARKLGPLNVEIADWGHWALAMVGETDDAIEWSKEQIRLHPNIGLVYSDASLSAAQVGDYQRAIGLATKGLELNPNSAFPLILLAQSYGFSGDLVSAEALLNQAEKSPNYVCPYESAVVYLQLGNIDKTFDLLNQAIEYRSNCLVFARNDPRLASLRNDPRFISILTRIGLDTQSVLAYPR